MQVPDGLGLFRPTPGGRFLRAFLYFGYRYRALLQQCIGNQHQRMNSPEIDENGHIVGIHNYCDRWCERCQLSDQCKVFRPPADTAEGGPARAAPEEFMEEVMHNFGKAMDMLQDMAADSGLDLTGLDTEEAMREFEEEQQKRKEAVDKSEAYKFAREYMDALNAWMDENRVFFEEKCDHLQARLLENPQDGAPFAQAIKVRDALEILRWYHFQVVGKVQRAVSGRHAEADWEDSVQTDSNGSAKVAHIGLQKSLTALEKMLAMFPEKTDDWLPIMALLQRTMRLVEAEFPRFAEFMRPGFDVMPEDT